MIAHSYRVSQSLDHFLCWLFSKNLSHTCVGESWRTIVESTVVE